AIPHEEVRENYWFVFYAERMDMMWIMTSEEFKTLSVRNKSGKNIGKHSIWFNGKKKNKATGQIDEHCRPRWLKFVASDFSRITADARELRARAQAIAT
uniref:hypothetical protein n=1 Tax=Xenophilus azovorans TaxID=151755 RepID=UPI001B80B96C